MAQESPSNLVYSQAAQAIAKLRREYSAQANQDPEQITKIIFETLTSFTETVGRALTPYEPVIKSEPPHSQKMNRFWEALQTDINLLQDQVDLLNASTAFLHNYIKTEIMKASKDNSRIQNKIKTLELYSNANDDSLVYFGDTFITEDFVDWTLVSDSERASLQANGYITLPVSDQASVLPGAKITVREGSNGFLGNNQEVQDPEVAIKDPVTGGKIHRFISETYKPQAVSSVIDNQPTTWLEFEKYLVSEGDRAKAKNFDFEYAINNAVSTAYLKPKSSSINEQQATNKINWADGITDGVLKLFLEIDLKSNKQVNFISLLPHGLSDNKNNPIRIVKVYTSANGTDWDVLGPENTWIANGIDKKVSAINAENVRVGSAAWATKGSVVRYIRFDIEQPKPIDCYIGHAYYIENSPAAMASTDDIQYRRQGPIPPAENPQFYLKEKNAVVNGLIQRREHFNGKRWAIGIRDIGVYKNIYGTKGVLVSKKFDIPGIVDRVAIEADVYIPEDYDQEVNWVKFYVSPDNGTNWFQISRIQDDFMDIPEVIAFNDPTPADLRDPGVGYYDVKSTANAIRVKVEITRPANATNSSPVLKSYKLKVIKRS